MNVKLYNIINPKKEILVELLEDLQKEYSSYADSSDFSAVVLLKALEEVLYDL
jgi:hypothetical protein